MLRRSFVVTWLIVLALPLYAQGTLSGAPPAAPPPLATISAAALGNQPLQPGDTINVTVAGEPTLTGPCTIREDGRLIFPIIGDVKVAGYTPTLLADRLADLLHRYVVQPVVSVTVVNAVPRGVSILGDVPRPGLYELAQAPNISALLAICGASMANVRDAVLVRKGELIQLGNDGKPLPAELALEAGDVVSIPTREAAMVQVAGAVKSPGPLSLQSSGTVCKAVLMAGGVTPEGDPQAAYVLRGGTRIAVDVATLLTGDDDTGDVLLRPGDILVVPSRIESSIYVLGEVKTAGPQILNKPVHVTGAIAQAGGLTETADGTRASILRQGERVPLNLLALLQDGTSTDDPVLRPGDVLVIPRSSSMVYLAGQVAKPGPVPYATARTVVAAWSQAGGATVEGDIGNAMLVRGSETKRLNLGALDKGDLKYNLPLQPGDTILVPLAAQTMYVLGQVNRPGIYPVREGDTLLDIIAEAGGPTGVASTGECALVRKCVPGKLAAVGAVKPQPTKSLQPADKLQDAINRGLNIQFLDLARIQAGREDVYMAQPGDLLYIPAQKQRRIDWLQVLVSLGTGLLIR